MRLNAFVRVSLCRVHNHFNVRERMQVGDGQVFLHDTIKERKLYSDTKIVRVNKCAIEGCRADADHYVVVQLIMRPRYKTPVLTEDIG